MKSSKSNKSLFWHGVFAKLKILLGTIMLVAGLITLLISTIGGIILIILGIGFMIWGKQQRFDYKMQSGSMIHWGDW